MSNSDELYTEGALAEAPDTWTFQDVFSAYSLADVYHIEEQMQAFDFLDFHRMSIPHPYGRYYGSQYNYIVMPAEYTDNFLRSRLNTYTIADAMRKNIHPYVFWRSLDTVKTLVEKAAVITYVCACNALSYCGFISDEMALISKQLMQSVMDMNLPIYQKGPPNMFRAVYYDIPDLGYYAYFCQRDIETIDDLFEYISRLFEIFCSTTSVISFKWDKKSRS